MAKCEHGVENCIHIGHVHDDDCCFGGWWEHEYVCQECGYTMQSQKFSLTKGADGTLVVPQFKVKNCPKCKSEKTLVQADV